MMQSTHRPRRGFLLLVVVGLLAVLLAVVVGFLSYTRTELGSVSHVRDNADSSDLAQSALDWTIGNIGSYLFSLNKTSNTYTVDPAFSDSSASGAPKYISNSNDTSGAWWYTPYDADVKTMGTKNSYNNPANYGAFVSPWGSPAPPKSTTFAQLCMQQKFATWKYMPQDYFSDGSILGRFQVQVLDGNAALNVNDWLEDCNPTQCQMAHLIQGGEGLQYFEGDRAGIDTTTNVTYTHASGYNQIATTRYQPSWLVASRTTHDLHYDWSYTGDYETLAPNFITTNTSWQGLFGAEFSALKACYYNELNTHKQSGWGWWPQVYCDHNGMYSFTIANHVDPDTGRSPLNVNTCEISGNVMPVVANNAWAWPLEGVFNIESLVRIIKVGKFWFSIPGGQTWLLDAQNPAAWSLQGPDRYHSVPGSAASPIPGLTPPQIAQALQHEEQLKMILAYRYQEMLVRYFCGYYHPYMYGNNYGNFENSWNTKWLFRYSGFAANRSYYQAFGYNAAQSNPAALTAAEVNKVLHAVKPDGTSPPNSYPPAAYYSKTRFPCDVNTFRQWVATDLIAMTKNNGGLDCVSGEDPTGVGNSWKDTTVVVAGYASAYQLTKQLQNGVVPDGELCVNFDQNNTPEIIPGKMDKRTANAIFDNIIPGKTWADAAGTKHFLLFGADGAGTFYNRNPNYVQHPVMPFPAANPPFPAGAPPLWHMAPDVTGNGIRDPLWELYCCRLGRDEYSYAQNNRQNFYVSVDTTPGNQTANKSDTSNNPIFNEKGKDIYFNPNADATVTLPVIPPYPLFPDPYSAAPVFPNAYPAGTAVVGNPPSPYGPVVPMQNVVPYDIQAIYEPRPNNNTQTTPNWWPAPAYPYSNGPAAGPPVWNPPIDTTQKVSSPGPQRPLVPWRQLIFGPDWFSTELTTSSPTYYLVVSSEIVDKNSAFGAPFSPTNPNPSPTILSHNQQLVCVELAPDINVETDSAYDGSQWPTGIVLTNRNINYQLNVVDGQRVGLGYYRGGWPRILKTNQVNDTSPQWAGWTASPPSPALPPLNTPQSTITGTNPPKSIWDNYSMDYGMATVYQVNKAGTQKYQPALPDSQSTTQNTGAPTSDATSVSSVAQQWLDYRCPVMEPEPTVPTPPPASRSPSFEINFYNAQGVPSAPYAGQTTKRVIVRYQWTLNQGL